MMKLPIEVTTRTWVAGAALVAAAEPSVFAWVLAAAAPAPELAAAVPDAAGGASAAKFKVGKAAEINPAMSIICFMLRDSTRIGTILRYVRNARLSACHDALCAQPDRFPALG